MRRMLCIAGVAGLIAVLAGGPGWGAEEKASAGKDQAVQQCSKSRFGRRLGLTEDQARKMKESMKARREAVRPLREKLREEKRALLELVRDDASEKDIQASLRRLKDLQKSLEAENERFKGKLEALLTPSQQAKMLLAMGKRKARGGFEMGGRGDGGRRGMRGEWGGRMGGGRGWGGRQAEGE